MPQSTDVIASNPMAQAPPLVSKSRTNEPNGFIAFPGLSASFSRRARPFALLLLCFPSLPFHTSNKYTKRSNNTQWSEHANVELKSPRRRNCSRFLRTVRRKKSEFYLFDVIFSESRARRVLSAHRSIKIACRVDEEALMNQEEEFCGKDQN